MGGGESLRVAWYRRAYAAASRPCAGNTGEKKRRSHMKEIEPRVKRRSS